MRNESTQYTCSENHYYQESALGVSEITDPLVQKFVDEHMQRHPKKLPPDDMARESGFSSIRLSHRVYSGLEINPSMLRTSQPAEDSSAFILSRLSVAPKLPVSCLASAEHVIAMQNKVTNFVSEDLPRSKKRVVYQILAKPLSFGVHNNVKEQLQHLREVIFDSDKTLQEKDVTITYKDKQYLIELSTARVDIQKTLMKIKRVAHFKIINYQLSDIRLNEGICLINGDGSNPIHALVNIADSEKQKCFVERDAGLTSGKLTHTYADNKWTFNFYSDLETLQRRAGYSEKSMAIKLCLKL